MQKLKILLKISRPRFWLYAGGTFWVGAIAGASNWSTLVTPMMLVYLTYFMIPANIFIYGINDLFDGDTDEFNSKKDDKENRLAQTDHSWLKLTVYTSMFLGLLLAFTTSSGKALIFWLIFLFLAWAYSSLPFRFKAKPFIDAISNVHYAVIGLVGYTIVSGAYPPLWAIVAAWTWTASMHIFSAIPDIESDNKAHLKTTAVLLGVNFSLVLCVILWIITAVLFNINTSYGFLGLIAWLYPIVALALMFNPITIHRVYWWFPYINGVVGLLLFWSIAIAKFF